ncbi:MAG: aminotransferase class I/II-fold pyridoxal phosphate-dependent enzyme, partial [Pseudomonadota bacterium]|nr:aminotransferase class I/II-fold pyridoxal phosphate-dependent enzyme [Pseudomonadota bacterium]
MSVTQVSHGGQLYAEAAKQGLTEQQALEKWIDFSASIPPWTFRPTAPLNELALQHYPDANHAELMHALQQRFQIAPEYISVCNGVSSAILNLFAYLRPKQTTLYAPIFGEYEKVAAAYGSQIQRINRLKDASLTPYSISDLAKIPVAKNSLVIWVNPSTPDGQHTDLESMKPLLDLWKQQNCLVVLDESFLPFIGFDTKLSGRSLLETWPKLIILQSLTKYYACPGLRVGAVFAHPDFLSQWPQAHWPISIVDQKILLQRLNEPSLETQNQALQTQLK